ncbi:response regulator transcription factor [Pontibacter pamirensis]|uniref:response regulator transcription factor n=1 Tax=Pontibacter pamirensis TaxID=2562824 RepID=UPI0013893AA5|nr:response regulator transcription factor [Pontibacter pamirensis]
MIRLVLTDDHKIIREGIRALLTQDNSIEVAGEAASGRELLELLVHTPVDIVLLDISMPDLDGFETMKLLHENFPDVKVLVLTMLDDERYVYQMLEIGAAGYLLKDTSTKEMQAAIKLIASGMQYISPALTLNLLQKSKSTPHVFASQGIKKPYKELSKREVEILQLISEGHTNAEISEVLFTSKRTIETHRQNLLEKTKTKNTAALIKFAVLNGIIS